METIINYLNNMFATLPKTKQILSLKEDLLSNMEDKYNELKESGKSENEAIGIVISEFGNIDELMKEFNIELEDEKKEIPILTEDEVNDYLRTNKKTGIFVGLGVFLCIFGVALLILITQLIDDRFITGLSEDTGYMVGLISLFLFVALAVGIFIYIGMVFEKNNYIKGNFELPIHIRKSIENKRDLFHPTYTLSVIIGVVLCILSPIVIFIALAIDINAARYGVVALLLTVSVAIFIFIYFGCIHISYKKLLKIED